MTGRKPSGSPSRGNDGNRSQGRRENVALGKGMAFGKQCFLLLALLLVALAIYQPAWRGGLLWDDHCHITRPELQSWHGLCRIWLHVKATTQYYPFLHSVFWVEYTLWSDTTLRFRGQSPQSPNSPEMFHINLGPGSLGIVVTVPEIPEHTAPHS